MNVLIVPNLRKKDAAFHTREILRRFLALGCTCLMGNQMADLFADTGAVFGEEEEHLAHVDLLVAIGGDGTIIHCAKDAVKAGVPVLGINVGRLGFLAQLEMTQLELIDEVVSGRCRIQERMMLEATKVDSDGHREKYLALNDIVLSTGALARMVDLNVMCEKDHVGRYRADGLIFATPTGSTAYSMSAGGPIIDPVIDTIIMTPICPHALSSRPILFSPEKMLRVNQLIINEENKLYMTIDGEQALKILPEDYVEIRCSSQRIKLVTFETRSFFGILGEKFGHG